MKFRATVQITLRPSVLDPQGVAVRAGLQQMGYAQVEEVRVGKYVQLELEAESEEQARQQVDRISDQLLANPVIENYRFDLVAV
ncbi:MAG: phosphoribosylformylglycinamidine synthase subunit PurS [Gloeobacterales cyanobacterium]